MLHNEYVRMFSAHDVLTHVLEDRNDKENTHDLHLMKFKNHSLFLLIKQFLSMRPSKLRCKSVKRGNVNSMYVCIY